MFALFNACSNRDRIGKLWKRWKILRRSGAHRRPPVGSRGNVPVGSGDSKEDTNRNCVQCQWLSRVSRVSYEWQQWKPKGSYWQSVSWYFEPSQPQRITSRPKTMFNLSPIYSARKSSNHKLFTHPSINPDSNPHKKKPKKNHKHRTKFFRSISPFSTAPVKKCAYG